MKNFIVPLDFSLESLNGLKMALLFSRKEKVNIRMVYVLTRVADQDRNEMVKEQQDAEQKFSRILQEYTPQLGNESTLDFVIGKGRIYQEVAALAESMPDTMITASTHGASGFQELFIGSNAFRIISSTDRPVIAIRKNNCPAEIRKIILPIDLSIDSRQKVPYTLELAKLFNATIHVVGIQTLRGFGNKHRIRSYVSQVASYIEDKVPCETNEVSGDNTAELVTNYANSIKADLISITTERSSGLSLLIGNTVHQVLNKTEVPVLCLTPKNIRKSGTFVTTGG
jgi:nucleotide-binding universal stress UspA family protein